MLNVKKKKSRVGMKIRVSHNGGKHHHGVKEVFLGFETIIALVSFTVGAIMIGRSLWQLSFEAYGHTYTILIGFAIFVFSGIVLGRFHIR